MASPAADRMWWMLMRKRQGITPRSEIRCCTDFLIYRNIRNSISQNLIHQVSYEEIKTLTLGCWFMLLDRSVDFLPFGIEFCRPKMSKKDLFVASFLLFSPDECGWWYRADMIKNKSESLKPAAQLRKTGLGRFRGFASKYGLGVIYFPR